MKEVISTYLKLHTKLLWVLWVGFWENLLGLCKKQEGVVLQQHNVMLHIKRKTLDHLTSQRFQKGTPLFYNSFISFPPAQPHPSWFSTPLYSSLFSLLRRKNESKTKLVFWMQLFEPFPFSWGREVLGLQQHSHPLSLIPLVSHQGSFPKESFPP